MTLLGNNFLDMAPKLQTTKEKEKENITKIVLICFSKDTIEKVKGYPQDGRKYL